MYATDINARLAEWHEAPAHRWRKAGKFLICCLQVSPAVLSYNKESSKRRSGAWSISRVSLAINEKLLVSLPALVVHYISKRVMWQID
jgi:hypothetical protein